MLESKGYQQSEREPMDWPKCNDSACSGRVDPNTLRCDTCDKSVRHPTPSITVGTQVRLTGVVTRIPGDPDVEDPEFPETEYRVQIVGAVGPEGETGVWFRDATLKNLEVIRQPFKRGEVVYSKISATNEEPYVVLNDESLGMVDVTCCRTGFYIANDNPEAYERRP